MSPVGESVGFPAFWVERNSPGGRKQGGRREWPEGLEWAINGSSLCALSKQIQKPAQLPLEEYVASFGTPQLTA